MKNCREYYTDKEKLEKVEEISDEIKILRSELERKNKELHKAKNKLHGYEFDESIIGKYIKYYNSVYEITGLDKHTLKCNVFYLIYGGTISSIRGERGEFIPSTEISVNKLLQKYTKYKILSDDSLIIQQIEIFKERNDLK